MRYRSREARRIVISPHRSAVAAGVGTGRPSARATSWPLVYRELRRRAGAYLEARASATTRCSRRRWSTRRICGSLGQDRSPGRTAHTFSGGCADDAANLDRSRTRASGGQAPRSRLQSDPGRPIGAVQPRECELIACWIEALSEFTPGRGKDRSWSSVLWWLCRRKKSRPCCRCHAGLSRVNGEPHVRGCTAA